MPRFTVPPKFIYTQGAGTYYLEYSINNNNSVRRNGMYDPVEASIISPTIELPDIGNGHNCRKSNRITVTSIRYKLSITLNNNVLAKYAWSDPNEVASFKNAQVPPNPCQFFKFRYFLLSIDEDVRFTKFDFYRWFYSTYCFYRNASVTPVEQGPNSSDAFANIVPGPISVHSNVLRMTTPWTGKFNILADKMFTVTSKHPQLSLDFTIPINREYVWDEVYTPGASTLLYPKIYAVIVGPQSFEIDTDPVNFNIIQNAGSSSNSYVSVPLAHLRWWSKLNFIDL